MYVKKFTDWLNEQAGSKTASDEARNAFIEYMEDEMDWNRPQLTYVKEYDHFEYECAGGSSVILDLKEAAEAAQLKIQANWNMEPVNRTERAGWDTHYYLIKVKSDLEAWFKTGWYNQHRGARLGKQVGITEGAIKDKLIEIAEKAVSVLDTWLSKPKKPFEQMSDNEREGLISLEIDKFFKLAYPKDFDQDFLKSNKDIIVSTISTLLS